MIYLLFFFSGAAGLVYELIWVREITRILGGTTHAITTVLAAFMGGLALGSMISGRRAGGIRSPLRTYGLLEIGIGLAAVAVQIGFAAAVPLYRALYRGAGPEGMLLLAAARFFVSALLLVIPTTLMGATLPVLVEHGVRRHSRFGNVTGLFYGLNTVGAAVGAGLGGFLLLPRLGQRGALSAAVGTNLLLGAAALLLRRRFEGEAGAGREADRTVLERESAPGAALGAPIRALVLLSAALSGFAAMTYQIGWTRLLMVILGSSTYAFTSVLVVFILALGAGALIVGATAHRIRRPVFALGVAQGVVALGALGILPFFGGLPEKVAEELRLAGGVDFTLLARQFLLVLRLLALPTLALGTTLPLVVLTITRRSEEASRRVGAAYAVNTAGTIAGSVVAGFWLLAGPPGIAGTLGIAITLSALLGAVLIAGDGTAERSRRAAALAILLILLGAGTYQARRNPLDRATLTAGAFLGRIAEPGRIVYYRDGADATVSVHVVDRDVRILRINGKPDASTDFGDMPTQVACAQVPILLSPRPERVMIVGLGGGITLASAVSHPGAKSIDLLEISDAVIEGATLHFAPLLGGAFEDPRVRILRNDGRNHLLLTPHRYDVIISEPSNPWLTGIASLFTEEYFRLARDRLAEGGVYGQWLQSYGMSPRDFRMVVRTMASVFPEVSLWQPQYADFLLIGRTDPSPVPLDSIAARMREPSVYRDLESVGLEHPSRLLGACLLDDKVLRAWLGPGPLNTDDNGLLEFSAPLQRLRDWSRTLAGSLARSPGSAFNGIVAADSGNPSHRSVIDGAARNRQALFAIYEITGRAPDRLTLVRSVERLLSLDGADWRVFRQIRSAAVQLRNSLATDPGPGLAETRRLVGRLDRELHPPPTGPLTPPGVKEALAPTWLEEAKTAGAEGREIDAAELRARAGLRGGAPGPLDAGYPAQDHVK
ncbi:MAG: fused MFS/spermidine synthase [Candidatus Eisenbacteria bacterium]